MSTEAGGTLIRSGPFSTERRLARCHSIADLRRCAERRLPRAVFDYADGAAEDEVTLARNTSAFDAYELLPRTLVDVSDVDLSTSVLGQPVDLPLILAPTGFTRLFHHRGEIAAALAAREAGLLYTLSSLSTTSIEDLAAAVPGPHWFQIYVWRNRSVLKEFIERCRASCYATLCLTVDMPT
ncbi:MAG TPA: alpha-hydroxy-acid oxidizing protein, partial [Myxococcota bacterium]